jgi:hypothetical protein
MITDTDQAQIEQHMDNVDWFASVLKSASHIRWCFESAPSLRDIELHVAAFFEQYGEYPELIVVDNLLDCTHTDGDEWGSMRSLLREFKWWARETGSAFLVLHHTSEAVKSDPCPPRSAIQGKVAQTPALILTVASERPGFMGVCPVKNRYGPADPSGGSPSWLAYEPARMYIADMGAR